MGMSSTAQLFTNVTDATDGSSSSCPPSATSDESVPEGYLILTFDKTKRAKLKTAVFADVSDCQFADDGEDDNYGDEDVEDGYMWTNNDPVDPPAVSSTQPEGQNPEYYGEAVWVGEASENVQPPVSSHQQTTGSTSLIRVSLLENQPPRTGLLVQQKPSETGSERPMPSSKLGSLNNVISPSKLAVIPPRSNNTTNGRPANWSRPRPMPFLKNRFLANSRTYYHDIEADNEKYPRKMLRCMACGKYYRNMYSLHHHICLKRKDVWKKGDVPSEVIDGQVVYFCPTCRKPFKWLGNLTRHFYVHTGQRFFKCDVCSKEFFSAYQVKRHMNSHTGRRFKCEVCDKPFTCKYACAWHTRQHYINTK